MEQESSNLRPMIDRQKFEKLTSGGCHGAVGAMHQQRPHEASVSFSARALGLYPCNP
jgi:hypothetical protein